MDSNSSASFHQVSPDGSTQDAVITDKPLTYTFDQAMDHVGFGLYQIILMQICGAGWFFDGIELMMISFVLPQLTKLWHLTPVMAGLLGSAVFFGMMFGASFGGILGDRFGRRFVFITATFVTSVFGLATAFSVNVYMFLILRIFVGVGLGASVPVDMSLFMEFVPTRNRGTVLVLMNLYWGVGAMLECGLAWAILPGPDVFPGNEWRWLVGASAAPGFIIFIIRLFVSESPRYMLVSGKLDLAFKELQRVAKWNRSTVPQGKLVYHETEHTGKNKSIRNVLLLFHRKMWLTTVLLWIMWFCLSLGSWGFGFIGPLAFEKVGSKNIYRNQFIVELAGTFGYAAVLLFVNRVGRRILMSIGFLATGILTTMISFSEDVYYLLVLSIIVTIVSSFPWAIIYMYTPEAYPTPLRATGLGSCSTWTRIAGTITPVLGVVLLKTGYVYPFLCYGISLIVAGVAAAFLPIETLGRDLQDEIDEDTTKSAKEIKKQQKDDTLMREPLLLNVTEEQDL